MHRGCARKWFQRCLIRNGSNPVCTCPVCREPQRDTAALAQIGVVVPPPNPSLSAADQTLFPAHLPPWPPGPDGLPDPLNEILGDHHDDAYNPNYRHPVTIRPDKRTLFNWQNYTAVQWNRETFTEAWPRKDPTSWRFRWQRLARLTDSDGVRYFDQWGFPHFYKHNVWASVWDLPLADRRLNNIYELIQAAQNTVEMFFQGVCYRLCDLWHANDPTYHPLAVLFLP
uniref:RING-CH-type domain-containing protein n=1 Tax=Chromera velia CCMP2878 TaxID=1169474 RepID=A0A0G4HCU5_9ALVE|eukprot:Cvel_949.t1-p1 / transcript=Cvel_949.t1 / gene=Cvel_949 / organism=Chromera_velia_CCMP2878 / gene_product=hypothetical protein / transcript_product=hypothetical protein / location=Cvel_scaffold30:135977-136654(-) / protein_length=226 / sequence_SO=supercontig / SO=protein_coding / is_pseudo=false